MFARRGSVWLFGIVSCCKARCTDCGFGKNRVDSAVLIIWPVMDTILLRICNGDLVFGFLHIIFAVESGRCGLIAMSAVIFGAHLPV